MVSQLKDLTKIIENDFSERLVVPDKLIKPDSLILTAKESLAKSNLYVHHGLAFTKGLEINIRVAPSNISRAIRFMDTLIKLITARGHKIDYKDGEAGILIGEEFIKVSLREKLSMKIIKGEHYNTSRFTPSGIFMLTIPKPYSYTIVSKDGKQPIEKLLALSLAKLELIAQKEKEERIEREKYWAERDREEAIQKELQEKKENELTSFKSLIKDVQRWKQVEILREYLKAMEAAPSDQRKTQEWLNWAKNKVNWYDPQIESEDELLKDVDKETLEFKEKSWWE